MTSGVVHPDWPLAAGERTTSATVRLSDCIGRYVLVLAVLGIAYTSSAFISDGVLFVGLNVLLVGYVGLECLSIRRSDPHRWLANPAVAASVVTFLLSVAVPNLAYLSENTGSSYLAATFLGSDTQYHWLNRAMILAIVAAVAMWIGFRASLGLIMGSALHKRAKDAALLRQTYRLRLPVVVVLTVVALAARLVQARLGVYGYGADPEQLYAAAPFTQFLSLTAGFTKFVLLAAALTFFSRTRTDWMVRTLLIAAFALEILFGGFLAGFKGGVFFPVLTVGVAYYWFHFRVKLRFVLAGVLLLLTAYAVVEPFRALRWADPSFDSRSITSIGSTVAIAVENRGELGSETSSGLSVVGLRVLNRSNLTNFAAISIKFKTEEGLPEDAPRFLMNLITSPVAAFIPRLIWRDKPLQNIGYWFNVRVLRAPGFNAMAMSPFGYLYFAGGGIAVFLGFLAAGVFLRLIFEFLRHDAGGVLVYLGLFPMLAIIDSAFYVLFAGALQSAVLFLIVQRFIYKR